MKIIRKAFWIAGIIIVASLILLTMHFTSNDLDFSQYNNGWNGTSSFFTDLDRHHVSMVNDPSGILQQKDPATLLIIAPFKAPKPSEISAYRTFLDRGNTLILLDDFGTGNDILRGIGSQISILPGNLSSLDREYDDPYSVVVYGMAASPLTDAGTTIVLNRPAALDGGKTLLMTSVLSWIDLDGDKKISLDESMGNFPVMAREEMGRGNLYVLSDPSIFTNSMYSSGGEKDNMKLIHRITGGNSTILLDQMNSRTADAEGISWLFHQTRSNLGFKILFLFMLLLFFMAIWKSRIP